MERREYVGDESHKSALTPYPGPVGCVAQNIQAQSKSTKRINLLVDIYDTHVGRESMRETTIAKLSGFQHVRNAQDYLCIELQTLTSVSRVMGPPRGSPAILPLYGPGLGVSPLRSEFKM